MLVPNFRNFKEAEIFSEGLDELHLIEFKKMREEKIARMRAEIIKNSNKKASNEFVAEMQFWMEIINKAEHRLVGIQKGGDR